MKKRLLSVSAIIALIPLAMVWNRTPDVAQLAGSLTEIQMASIIDWRSEREVQPMKGYLHSEPVVWAAITADNWGILSDRTYLRLSLPNNLSEVVCKWPEGMKLFLCYSEEKGPLLLEPKSGLEISVFDSKPVRDYISSLSVGGESGSTYGQITIACEHERVNCQEIDRMVRYLLSKKHLPEEMRNSLIRLSWVRFEYMEVQSGLASKAIRNSCRGTNAGIYTSSYCAEMSERLLNDLYRVGAEFDSFDEELDDYFLYFFYR